MPLLTGFSGTYCFRVERPVNLSSLRQLLPLGGDPRDLRSVMKDGRSKAAFKPAVHLDIQEVHLVSLSIPVLSRSSFTKSTRQSNSSTLFLFNSYNSEMSMSSAVNVFCMLSASARRSASRTKWHILVPLYGFLCFKHHSVALYRFRTGGNYNV